MTVASPKQKSWFSWSLGAAAALLGGIGWLASNRPEDAQSILSEWLPFVEGMLPDGVTVATLLWALGGLSLLAVGVVQRRPIIAATRKFPGQVRGAYLGWLHPPAAVVPLTAEEASAINHLRSFYRLTAVPAMRALETLLSRIRSNGRRRTTFSWLVDEVTLSLPEVIKEAETLLEDAGTTRLSALQDFTLRFSTLYLRAIRCVHGWEHEGVRLGEANVFREYVAWQTAHEAYRARLTQLCAETTLGPIRRRLESDARASWNAKSFADETVAEKMTELLNNPSPEQSSFLALFLAHEPHPAPGAPDLLPYRVYRAGVGMVQRRLMTSRDLTDGSTEFTIAPPALRAWSGRADAPLAIRPSVTIDLSLVEGTGASGGGA